MTSPAAYASWRRRQPLSLSWQALLRQQAEAAQVELVATKRQVEQGDRQQAELRGDEDGPGVAVQGLHQAGRDDRPERCAQQVQADQEDGDHRGAEAERG